MTRTFLDRIPIEGAGGAEPTPGDRLSIAAQACFLLVGMERPEIFPRTEAIIVYPGRFTPKRPDFQYHWYEVQPVDGPRIGEAWGTGVVVLALDGIRRGARPDATGNLVMHEFAHRLDQLGGAASGHPPGMPPDVGWPGILRKRLEEMQRRIEAGLDTVIDPYGAKNRAEFFAVATETFFLNPQRLREGMPDVFASLARYYRRDPVAERARAGLPSGGRVRPPAAPTPPRPGSRGAS